jgi:hypothetical protein
MPRGRVRGRSGPMPADAGVLEQRSRPRNSTRPDELTRGLSATAAGRGRAGARGVLPWWYESDEDAEEEDDARVSSGCAHGCCSCRLGGSASPAPVVGRLDTRWRRLATGAERVHGGDRDGCGGRCAGLPESTEEVDEDDEESRETSDRRKWISRRFRHSASAEFLSSPPPPGLAFLVTRRRRSRHRRPAHRGARGDPGSVAGSTSRHGGGEQGGDSGCGGGSKGTSFPPQNSSSAAESAAAAAGTRNSNSSASRSQGGAADGEA